MENRLDVYGEDKGKINNDNFLDSDLQNMHNNLHQRYRELKDQIIMNESISKRINTIVKDFNNFCIALSENPIDYAQTYMYDNYFYGLPKEYSSLPVSHANEYKKYLIDTEDNSFEALLHTLSEIIDLLKKPLIAGQATPEKKEYMDEFKTTFDQRYEDPEFQGKKNYMFDGLGGAYRQKLIEESSINKEIFAKIVRSTYFNKDRMLAHIQRQKSRIEAQKNIFDNEGIVYKDVSNQLVSYWKDVKKYHDMGGSITIKFDTLVDTYTSIKNIMIDGETVKFLFGNDIQTEDSVRVLSLKEAMKNDIIIKPIE